ncbi:MAG: hypothetical protein HYY37_03870 [Candidatus Aenigmarchaeota archaeon]|nr:hypothetical protein [Candidatus Aenigmarchaeota archaeon]
MGKGSVVTAVVAVAIIVTSSLVVINTINPTLEQGQAYTDLAKAKEVMTVVDSVVRELAFEAPGARRSVRVSADAGVFEVSGSEDSLKLRLEQKAEVLAAGTAVREGNMLITSGSAMKAYEGDINSDGTTDLVMENDAVLFAVRKVGTAGSWSSINLTSIITRIGNKRGHVNATPIVAIYIEDIANTTYGTGYTQLTSTGSSLQSAGIKIFVNSTGGTEYEALFTLRADQDFLEMEVKNVRRI